MLGSLEIPDWIVAGRGLDQSGEHRRLRQRQLGNALVEIEARCCRHPVGTSSKVDPVEIACENLILPEAMVQPDGSESLPDLAVEAAFIADDLKLGQLLGDRTAAFDNPARTPVRVDGPGDTPRIYCPMRIEPPVFNAQNRLDEHFGKILARDVVCEGADAPDRLPVGRLDQQRRTAGPSAPF